MHGISLDEKLALVREQGSPKAVGRVNDVLIKVVKLKGEFLIVPRGTEHRPVADEETHVLAVEPAPTVDTGNAGGPRTRGVEQV